jgi:DNA-binding GntR family transcriptional regulator
MAEVNNENEAAMSIIFRSKNEVVYDLLHQAIVRGDYKSGERVVIDDVASKLGVSQIPVREALRQLEAEGFVNIEPYIGATVTDIGADLVFEIFVLLETMEAICSRTACCRMSEEEIQKLDDLVQRMDECVNQPENWSELNKKFHLLICDYAHTGLIKEMMRKVLDHWDRLRLHYLKDVLGQRIEKAQIEHRQIMAAFHSRDADKAERLVRTHNQNALAAYNNYLKAAGYLNGDKGDCE